MLCTFIDPDQTFLQPKAYSEDITFKGRIMKMLVDLFSTDYGLMSVAVIAFMLGMAVWFRRFFLRKMREDEAASL